MTTTRDPASEAAAHLYVALIQSLPSDDYIIIANVRAALRLLDPAMLARVDHILAEVRSAEVAQVEYDEERRGQ